MKKIVKVDFNKLKVGMEVFDMIDGWCKVIFIANNSETTYCLKTEKNVFTKEGKLYIHDRIPRLVAMKIEMKVEDVPTKEFCMHKMNYYIIESEGSWEVQHSIVHETFGTKYYTFENAELVAKILNEKEE